MTNNKRKYGGYKDINKYILNKRYHDMVNRCTKPNMKCYKHYGGRGITVCDEWLSKDSGFKNFYQWAISNGFSRELQLDRKENDKGYSPDNCRWVTSRIQNINQRKSESCKSKFIGISQHIKSKHWYGRVKVFGKCYCTGTSANEFEAAKMRNDYIISHGLDNKLNELQEGNNEA